MDILWYYIILTNFVLKLLHGISSVSLIPEQLLWVDRVFFTNVGPTLGQKDLNLHRPFRLLRYPRPRRAPGQKKYAAPLKTTPPITMASLWFYGDFFWGAPCLVWCPPKKLSFFLGGLFFGNICFVKSEHYLSLLMIEVKTKEHTSKGLSESKKEGNSILGFFQTCV